MQAESGDCFNEEINLIIERNWIKILVKFSVLNYFLIVLKHKSIKGYPIKYRSNQFTRSYATN